MAYLESLERQKRFRDFHGVSDNSSMSPKMKARLIKLIESKPIISCKINQCDCQTLWDTGLMISLAPNAGVSNPHTGQHC